MQCLNIKNSILEWEMRKSYLKGVYRKSLAFSVFCQSVLPIRNVYGLMFCHSKNNQSEICTRTVYDLMFCSHFHIGGSWSLNTFTVISTFVAHARYSDSISSSIRFKSDLVAKWIQNIKQTETRISIPHNHLWIMQSICLWLLWLCFLYKNATNELIVCEGR